jgi:hypothetical protein
MNDNGNCCRWGKLHVGNNYIPIEIMKSKCYMTIGKTIMGV